MRKCVETSGTAVSQNVTFFHVLISEKYKDKSVMLSSEII